MSLTQERLKELLYYNPNTGKFKWLVNRGKARKMTLAGTQINGYIKIRINNKLYFAHRLAFLYILGTWPENEVDHINEKGTDNKWSNLRDVSHSINQINQKQAHSNNQTGYKGVCRVGEVFTSTFGREYLGCFSTPEAAHKKYLEAKIKYMEGV